MSTTPQKTNFLDADDLRPIIKFITKNWYLMILFSGIGLLFALFYTHRLPNIYAARCEILLKSTETYDYQTALNRDIGYYSLIQDITNQKRILTSYDLIQKVLKKADFTLSYYLVGRVKTEEVDRFAYFDIKCDWRRLDQKLYNKPFNLKILDLNTYSISYVLDGKKMIHNFEFGKLHQDANFTIQVDLFPRVDEVSLQSIQEQNFQFQVHHPDYLISKFKGSVGIDNAEFTSILTLTMRDMLESRAKIFLDTLASVYIEYTLQNQVLVNENTQEYIDKQLDEIMLIIDSLENVIENFKEERNILDLTKEQNIAFEALSRTEQEERELEQRRQSLDNLETFLTSEKDMSVIPPMNMLVGPDAQLNTLVLDLYNLRQRKSELLVDMKPSDRRVQKVDSVMKTIRNSIFRNSTDNKNQIEARLREVKLERIDAEKRLVDIPKSQRDLMGIERKLAVNEGQYTYLLQKKVNTVIARAGIVPQTSVIEAARSLGVVGPEKKGTIWLYVGVGFFIALIIGFVRAIFFERIENTRELKAYTRMSLLGGVPNYIDIDADPIVIMSNPRSNVSEAFRSMRTNLQYILTDEGPKVILVTSLHPGEGKTFVSVNLAAVLAKASKRVLVLDFDMHKPKVHKTFKLENLSGISTFLIGKTDYKHCIVTTQVENLEAITAGPVPPNASELVLNSRVDDLLNQLKEQYDFIIIDTPPLLLISDSLVLLSKADLGIFVMNTEKATKSGVRHLEDILLQNNLRKNALMLNNIKQKRWKYYYSKYAYRYGFGYGYGYGYGSSYGGYMYGNNYYTDEAEKKPKRRINPKNGA